ncbi:type I polyketide synthase [Dactylosporangium sp. NPDC051541]|uniref:type I polyketide synthase n=1 Tax=Dactylosporangium sp. NPDC051541 TaxID=3363977 RepID=UPI0037B84013
MAQEPLAHDRRDDAPAALLRRLHEAGDTDRDRILLDLVRAEVAAATGKPGPFAAGAPFRSIGVYRGIGTALREALVAATGLSIPATLLFDYPTPGAVAGFLRDGLLGDRPAATGVRPGRAPADHDDPVVIVGMACRYAGGVDTPEALWRLVADGVDAVSTFPADRGWNLAELYHPDPDHVGTCLTRHGSFLHDASRFDPAFFGISPREALGMDPQQRLLLEVAWEALESARIDPLSVGGSATGVYAGVPYTHYGPALHRPAEGMHGYLLTGSLNSVASGRISYTLGLEGPAVTVDTACSSSLVALHLAVQALRSGECDLALAGGVTVMSTPGVLMEFSRKRGLSPDGRCKAFSDDADGTGWGEGAGMLALERLSAARRAGHRVLAVVRGSALNQDGASNGLTAPNGPSQQRVIRAALADAGLAPSDVDMVEAHGTGTALGDPIEAQALLATYGQERAGTGPLWLGSLKSNVGHTQAAAGVGGIIKAVMSIRRATMPRTLHVSAPSTHVDWSAGAVALLTAARDWPAPTGRPRRAAVSSFGVSGTNAHVIIEEAPAEPVAADPPATPPFVAMPLAARGAAALRAQAGRIAEHLAAHPEPDPADVAWSLATTRAALPDRAVVVGRDRDELRARLLDLAADAPLTGPARPGGQVAFVFPGQGSQWAGMAVELLDTEPVFAAAIERCAAAFAPLTDWDLTAALRSGAPLTRVDVVQPVLFAVMVALAELWRARGVEPAVVVGHSQGEIAAACVAGVLTLPDAARVVILRSRALSALAGRGGMASVALPEPEVAERIRPWAGRLGIATVNGPAAVVVSGEVAALEEFQAAAEADGARVRRVDVDYASHGEQVEAIHDELLELLAPVTPRAGAIAMHSTVGADLTGVELAGAEYWYRNLRHTVRFADAVRALAARGVTEFVEVSPHPVLTVGIADVLDELGGEGFVTGTLRRDDGGPERFLTSLGALWSHGAEVGWAAVLGAGRRTVDLPTYPFQRDRYWLDAPLLDERTPAGTLDAEFWTAVERSDAQGLAGVLAAEPAAVAAVLPALRAWHEQRAVRGVVDGWRYQIRWDAFDLPAVRLEGRWLVAGPSGDALVAAVATALDAHGATVHVAGAFDGGDYAGVVSLLALDERPHAEHPVVPAGTAANLALLRELTARDSRARLWCVTRGAVGVAGAAPVSPEQAQTWGLGRVAALEYPQRWGGLVDLPPQPAPAELAGLCAVLAGIGGEDQVAIRAGRAYGRRLVRAATGADRPPRTWRPDGTVLVTGGTGALGGHVARWLVAGGARHLVLISRRGPQAPGVAALTEELTALGARVRVVACDVADRADLEALVADCAAAGEPIRTVLHTAGVADLAPLAELTVAGLARVAAGKVGGARHLDALLDDVHTVVYFSSIAATWGVGDHGAYAAANAHLDALAERQRAAGVAVHTVNWGPWAGGGMIADSLAETLRRRGVPLIDPEPSLHALQQLLDHDDAAIAVADVDWETFAAVFGAARPSPLIGELPEVRRALATGSAPAAGTGGLAELDPADRDRVLLDLVRGQIARVLGHGSPETVEVRRAFMELGFDSLSAVELRNGLSGATGLRLPATVVFDHPTPVDLARFLRTELFGDAAAPAAAAPVAAIDASDPVVVVGLGCRYPGGVRTPEDLWRLLVDEVDAVGPMPADRGWDLAALYDPDPDRSGTTYVRHGGFLYDAADFDPDPFGISPREALAMDPQQRLLLEVAWETAERARIAPASLRGSRTGVFVGLADQAYGSRLQAGAEGTDGLEGYLVTGGASSVASGRISYVLGLEGPAVTVDTACSSSLVALHLAAESLRRGECDLALAGAAMVMSTPAQFVGFSRQRGLARDGRCKAFGASADGFGLAEGAGMVMLERLSDARRHGRQVLAVLRGSAVNQDGASNGLTAPNGPSQQRVIRNALAAAGLGAGDVDAVEAHGTGTLLGDPIEAQALLATYGRDRDPDRPLWLGSLKSNIGHTQTAAGIGGVIKMVLAMRHARLPRTLHAEEPSPHVDWSAGAVELLTRARDWPSGGRPRRAGVSSFGISGTNAHVILEEPPATAAEPAASPAPALVPLAVTAQTPAALAGQAARLRALEPFAPADVARSLLSTRSLLPERAVMLGDPGPGLAALAGGADAPDIVRGRADVDGRTVFVFPGQGAQWAGMAAGLLDEAPVFRAAIEDCERALAPHVEWSLIAVLRGSPGAPGLDRVDVVQPASWAVMVALAELWRSFGVRPDAVVGHSQGEIAAACAAGMLSLDDAARVVAVRSRAIVALAGTGAMASVSLPEEEVRRRIAARGDELEIAVVNGPAAVVVSGPVAAVRAFVAAVAAEDVRARLVDVDYASHSARVEPIAGTLRAGLAGLAGAAGTVPMLSTATGQWLAGPQLDAGYWYRNLRAPVRFADAVERLVADGYRVFVECSPHPVLTVPVLETADAVAGGGAFVVAGSLRRHEGGLARFAASAAELFVRGVDVDWSPVLGPAGPGVDLPTYAFQRRRFWLDPAPGRPAGSDPADTAFWGAVRDADVPGLARTLGVAEDAVAAVLPGLRGWRAGAQRRERLDSWRYAVRWTSLPEPDRARLDGRWLIVAPPFGVPGVDGRIRTLTAALQRSGATVEVLRPAGADAGRDGFTAALRAAAGAGPVAGVVSLLGADEAPPPGRPGLTAGIVAEVALVRALRDAGVGAPLWWLTSGADGEAPAQALGWGLGIVAGLDDPARPGGLIDVPAQLDDAAGDRLCAVLAGAAGDERQLMLRTTGLSGRRLERAPLDPAAPRTPWRPTGSVLITGGTGALGAHVARYLAAAGAPRLVLVGRRGPSAPGAAELAAELAAQGADVSVEACDVADREALRALLAAQPADRPITAVVHCAGVTGAERALADTGPADLAAILGPKAAGAANLHELFADRALDAFVLFSSGAGVWGNAGQAAYAAGNAYLAALARHRRALGLAALCVAWGAWDGGGLVDAAEADRLARHGVLGMDPADAVAALVEAVEHDETDLVVARVDWARFGALYALGAHHRLLAGLPEARATGERGAAPAPTGATGATGRLLGLDAEARRRELVHLVRSHAAGTLGHADPEAVHASRPFRELGFDSLTAVDLRNKLTAATGLRLPVTVVFDHPTPVALARHLDAELVPESVEGPLAALDALAAARPDEQRDPAVRRQVAERLRSLLRRWEDAAGADGAADELDTASDDEMFDLIDRELGIS